VVKHLTERSLGRPSELLVRFVAELAALAVLAEPCGAEIVAELGLVVVVAVLLDADLHAAVSERTLHTMHHTASLKGQWPVALQ